MHPGSLRALYVVDRVVADIQAAPAGDAEPGQYDVIIIDPPRAGCSPELIDRLAELAAYARSLVYMSCNPQTLARDLAMLRERGITVCGELTPIDMFPCTGHVECIAKLSRKKS